LEKNIIIIIINLLLLLLLLLLSQHSAPWQSGSSSGLGFCQTTDPVALESRNYFRENTHG